ncbi:MAG: potassium channel family protein [Nanoarchaeota archaeon]
MARLKEIMGVLFALFLLIGAGSYAYIRLEGLTPLDAVYFSVTTLTTIGYGDFAPKSEGGKMFTIIYAIVGVGVMLYSMSIIARYYMDRHRELIERRLYNSTATLGRHIEDLVLPGRNKKKGKKGLSSAHIAQHGNAEKDNNNTP